MSKSIDELIQKSEINSLTGEEFVNLEKSNVFLKKIKHVSYINSTGHTIGVYVKDIEEGDDLTKSHDSVNSLASSFRYDQNIFVEKTGKQIKEATEELLESVESELLSIKNFVEGLVELIGEKPNEEVDDWCYKHGTKDKIGQYYVYCWEETIENQTTPNSHFSSVRELSSEKSNETNTAPKLKRLYNGKIYDYIQTYGNYIFLNSFIEGIDPKTKYKLNGEQLVILFPKLKNE